MARYVWPLKPDWTVWERRTEGLVHHAVALSCDYDPCAFNPGGAVPPLARDRYLRRLDVVESMIQDRKLAFTVRPFGKTHADYVRFDDFARMALGLNWILPSRFPGRSDRCSSPTHARRSATPVSLVASTMRLFLALTRKDSVTFKKALGLDRRALAVQIDAALGWEARKDGTPSHEALALASAIRAAERADADLPVHEPVPKERKPAAGKPRRRSRRSVQG